MSEFKQFKTNKGNVRYQQDGKFVKKSEVSDNVKTLLAQDDSVEAVHTDENGDVLDVVTEQDENSNEDDGSGDEDEQKVYMQENTDDVDDDVSDDEDESLNAPDPAEQVQEPVQPTATSVPQNEYGFGFPRANGKTLCIFTGKPFSHSRYMAGYIVPLSKESYDNRTTDEILNKLRELGKI